MGVVQIGKAKEVEPVRDGCFIMKNPAGAEVVVKTIVSQQGVPRFENFSPCPIQEEANEYSSWKRTNWGSKDYSDLSLHMDRIEQGEITLWFNSVWGVTETLTLTMSKQFKDLVFHHVYNEAGSGSVGSFDYVNGKETDAVPMDNKFESEIIEFLYKEDMIELS